MRRNIEVPGLGHRQPIPLATLVNGILVTGGINGKDPATGLVPENPEDEVAQAFANLRAVLEAADASLDDVAKITVYVTDRDIRKYVNPVWTRLFPSAESRPARHTLEANLTGMRLQLECLAVLS